MIEHDFDIPTAPVVTARFADYILRDSDTHGMKLRWVFPPYPVGFVSRETLQGYIKGNDPVTGKQLMQEMTDALLQPLTEGEKHPTIRKKPKWPRLLKKDTEQNLHRLFLENAWTDGLPIILPTEKRVAEMLTGTDHDPDEIVGRMSVTTHEERLEYTVEKIAVNAVMAGARPEHFPVILALAESQEPSMPSSTTSFGRMIVVNGPIRDMIGMNYEAAALSPFNYANSVIGRAYTLLTINLGDAKLADNFTATFGNISNYNNMCCAENERKSVYEPFHVEKGFKPEESTVSLFRGWNILHLGMGPAERMAEMMKGAVSMAFSCTFVMDPLTAKSLKEEQGFKTKNDLKKFLAEKSGLPYFMPENINLIVVGGEWNPMYITTDFMHTQTMSVDKWIPEKGIKHDDKALRMPVARNCSDGSCGIN
ncbi:MAG: hypothetical protein JW864_11485 [Spirochaetes bacterium]|nr:hypothetical protein [Spirochaetota bacterium]